MSRWPLRKAYFWQEAPLFRPLLPMIGGILCYDAGLPSAEYLLPVMILMGCSALLLLVLAGARGQRGLDAVFSFFLILFFATLGWTLYAAGDSRNSPHWFGRSMSPGALSVVRVKEEPRERAATTRATVSVLFQLEPGKAKPVTGDALLYVYRKPGSTPLAKGDTLVVPADWQPIRNSGNPFAFDHAAFQRRKGILFQQFLPPEKILSFAKADPERAGFIGRAHHWSGRQLKAHIGDSAALGLMQAMLLGDESDFDPALREAYSRTGVIHIVSISGSHVAMLFLVVTGLLWWIRGRRGVWIKYGVGVGLVWLYVLMAGAPPSALRSAVMFTIIALGVVSDREAQALNTLFGAALVLLIGEPAWLFSVGFQLSFGAVLSMLLFYRPVYRLWPQAGWLRNKAWQAVAASIAAEILTAPLVIYYFHNFPLLFIVANLLSVVLVGGLALVGGMAIIAFSWLPPLAAIIGDCVSALVGLFNTLIVWLQALNPVSFQYLQIGAAALVLSYVVIAAAGAAWLQRRRQGLLIALPALCALMAVLCGDRYAALRQERLVVYSNGRQPVAELIRGTSFTPLSGDAAGAYHARAAHTGWQAWRETMPGPRQHLIQVAGRTALILDDSTVQTFHGPLPVDVLILCRPLARLQAGSALQAFSPKTVVLAQRPSPYQLRRWRDSCAAYSAVLFNVAEEGAFLLD